MIFTPLVYPQYAQILSGSNVEAGWLLNIVVLALGSVLLILYNNQRSETNSKIAALKLEVQEVSEEVKDVREEVKGVQKHMHKQDISLAKICQHLGIED